VLGGGVAGLHAAGLLAERGTRVVLLEARDRLGGRVHTLNDPGFAAIEAGAEFVHGRPRLLERLLARAGLARVEMPARHLLVARGRHLATGAYARAGALLEALPTAGPDLSYAALERTPPWQRRAPALVRRLARDFVEGFNAAPATGVSVHALALQTRASTAIESDRMFHVRGGYGQLVADLAVRAQRAGAWLRTSACVTHVAWRPGHVEVRARGALAEPLPTLTAARALITLPLGVLKAPARARGAVAFSPALPAEKRAAITATPMGPVVRLVLRFASSEALAGLRATTRGPAATFLHVPGAAFPTYWRATSPDESPVLTAWAGGPPAVALAGQSDEQRLRLALQGLARGLGCRPRQVLDQLAAFHVFDWQEDPFARGAYSYSPPGGLGLPARLAAPVAGTLFFAGEATHAGGQTGTVHGALESAVQAAAALDGP
jgi:monoamine oxidase